MSPLAMITASIAKPRASSEVEVRTHGGDLAAAARRFPDAATPWIDLSTGINPTPYPIGTVSDAAWCRLPDAAALHDFEAVAAVAYGAGARQPAVAAPGTQALIQLLPRVLPARRVAILGFGYQEHPAVWQAAGADVAIVETVEGLEREAQGRAAVAVVVNPNNPDGHTVNPRDLAEVARRLARHGGSLVVDEAFADVCAAPVSILPLGPVPNTIVLRSFGKFFGLAGVRLGFAMADAAVASRLRAALGPWPVSGPAIEIATRALGDTAWQRREVARLHNAAARLDQCLQAAGLTVVGGTALFRLVESPHAAQWFERLGRAGILVRPFAEHPTWLRFGLPGAEDAWARLAQVLSG